MPGYVNESLHQFGHKTPINPNNQPYPAPVQTFGAYAQKMILLDTSPALRMERVKIIERIIIKLLYYERGVDNTFLFPLNTTDTKNGRTEQDEKTYTNV